MGIDGGYIIDISKYADRRSDDTIPHEKLREIPGRRVSDGVIHGAVKEVPDSAAGGIGPGGPPLQTRLYRDGRFLGPKKRAGRNSNGTARLLYWVHDNSTQQRL
jgi:hypothetical protein